jgi:hypothetical protein
MGMDVCGNEPATDVGGYFRTTSDRLLSVLGGPTCPTCASDDLRWVAPLGTLSTGQCRDCRTEYRWYGLPSAGGSPDDVAVLDEQTCPACGWRHCATETRSPFCEDCQLSDCAYCGITTHRRTLSENRACRTCEDGDAA